MYNRFFKHAIIKKLNKVLKANEINFAKTIPNLWVNWLNNGPTSLVDILPVAWEARLQASYQGVALRLQTLGRSDLLKTKLFAYCDRGTDFADCVAMAPSDEELSQAIGWVIRQDANDLWPAHVRSSFAALQNRLKHGS